MLAIQNCQAPTESPSSMQWKAVLQECIVTINLACLLNKYTTLVEMMYRGRAWWIRYIRIETKYNSKMLKQWAYNTNIIIISPHKSDRWSSTTTTEKIAAPEMRSIVNHYWSLIEWMQHKYAYAYFFLFCCYSLVVEHKKS